MNRKHVLLTFCVLLHLCTGAQHADYFPDSSAVVRQRIDEWQDLKFGLLLHWGAYSQWGIVESWSICPEDLSWAAGGRKKDFTGTYNEYVTAYEGLQTTFNPVAFDPQKWAEAAKYAGMKYVVFTTKHHDGFCMFDTRYTDYKVTDSLTPFSIHPKKNITKEVFDAFRGEQFWIGAYFSKPDWHSDYYWWRRFPAADRHCNYAIAKYPQRWQQFVDYTHGQVNELMSDYGKIDILWLDGGWVKKTADAEVLKDLTDVYEGSRWARNPQSQDIDMPGLVRAARAKQPGLIVVDRAVKGPYQNYLTPEQHIPETGLPYPWETCMTMATSWSYTPDDIYKPTDELIEKLVDIVSKGGNFLLNVGPGPDGTLHPDAYTRMREIGDWMQVNGEAIYGTRMYTVSGEGDSICYTQSKDSLTQYIFLFDFPEKAIVLEHFQADKHTRFELLGTTGALKHKSVNGKLQLYLPEELRASGKHVWVVKVSRRKV